MTAGVCWLVVLALLTLESQCKGKDDTSELEKDMRFKRAISSFPFNAWDDRKIYVKPMSGSDESLAESLVSKLKTMVFDGLDKCMTPASSSVNGFTTAKRHFVVQKSARVPDGVAEFRNGSNIIDVFMNNTSPDTMHFVNMTVTAFGLLYEDRSTDRDSYIKPVSGAFQEASYDDEETDSDDGNPYDISSFLHKNKYGLYQNKQGSNAAVKLRPIHPMLQHETRDNLGMGARLASRSNALLSFRDEKTLSRLFKCHEHKGTSCKTPTCVNGGYVNAECSCKCPPGLSGDTCEKVNTKTISPSFCGETKIASKKTDSLVPMHFPEDYDTSETCFWIIKSANPSKRVMFNLKLFNTSCETSDLTILMFGPEVELFPLSCKDVLMKEFVDRWFPSQLSYLAVSWKTSNITQKGYNGFKISFIEGCVDANDKPGFCLPDTKTWVSTDPIYCYNCNSSIDPDCALDSTLSPLNSIKCATGSSCYTQVTKKDGMTTTVKSCAGPTATCQNDEEACRADKQCTVCCKTPLCNKGGAAKRGNDPFDAIKSGINLSPVTLAPPPSQAAHADTDNVAILIAVMFVLLA